METEGLTKTHRAPPVHDVCPIYTVGRHSISMNPRAKELVEQLRKESRTVETGNMALFQIRRQTSTSAELDVLLAEESENQAERLEKQMVDLIGIAAEQKRLAAKLDVQTDTIISLTRWLRGLTIALVVLAIPLFLEALHLIKISENPVQITPHINQPIHNAQQNTNP
jgi:hypothetical protein